MSFLPGPARSRAVAASIADRGTTANRAPGWAHEEICALRLGRLNVPSMFGDTRPQDSRGRPIERLRQVSAFDGKLVGHSAVWTFEVHHHDLNRRQASRIGRDPGIDGAAGLRASERETAHEQPSGEFSREPATSVQRVVNDRLSPGEPPTVQPRIPGLKANSRAPAWRPCNGIRREPVEREADPGGRPARAATRL